MEDIRFNLITTRSTDKNTVKLTQDFNDRIKILIKEKTAFSAAAFCYNINEDFAENKELTIELLSKIINTYPHISMRWLITGEGEMEDKDFILRYNELYARVKTQGVIVDDAIKEANKNLKWAREEIDRLNKKINKK
jgi:hypothetical protein